MAGRACRRVSVARECLARLKQLCWQVGLGDMGVHVQQQQQAANMVVASRAVVVVVVVVVVTLLLACCVAVRTGRSFFTVAGRGGCLGVQGDLLSRGGVPKRFTFWFRGLVRRGVPQHTQCTRSGFQHGGQRLVSTAAPTCFGARPSGREKG